MTSGMMMHPLLGGSYVFDADSIAYFAAMAVQPDNARKLSIDELIKGLKADGVWTKIDWLILMAAHDAQAARINVRKPAKVATAVGAPTFQTDLGYTGAVNKNLDFGEGFAAVGNVFALNSAHLMIWTNFGTQGANSHGVGISGTYRLLVQSDAVNVMDYWRVNSDVDANQMSPMKNGSRIANRTGAAVNNFYKDGVSINTSVAASIAIPAGNALVFLGNNLYGTDRLSAAGYGAGLTATEAKAYHDRLAKYLGFGWDVDAYQAFAVMTVQPTEARKKLYNDLIVGLKADGVWNKLDALHMTLAHDAQAARVNLVRPEMTCTINGAPTFAVDRGYTGNAADFIVSAMGNPSTPVAGGSRFAQNSGFIMSYVNGGTGVNQNSMGEQQDLYNQIRSNNIGGNDQYALNQAAPFTLPNIGHYGSRIVSRTASNLVTVYRDGAVQNTNAGASGFATGTVNFTPMAAQGVGGNDRIAAAAWGAGLTATEALALHTRVEAYIGAFYEAETVAWIAACAVAPTSHYRTQIDNLIKGLKADGVWNKLDWLSTLAADNQQSALLNIKDPSKSLIAVGAPTFTQHKGFTVANGTKYLTAPDNLNTYAQYQLNSAHLAYWCNQQAANDGNFSGIGCVGGDTQGMSTALLVRANDGQASLAVNRAAGFNTIVTTAGVRTGFFCASRTTNAATQLYKTQAAVGAVQTAASTQVPAFPVQIGRNFDSALVLGADRYAAVSWGAGLTALDEANLYARINNLLLTLAAQ